VVGVVAQLLQLIAYHLLHMHYSMSFGGHTPVMQLKEIDGVSLSLAGLH
jgi:hypothetical protein